MFCNNCGTQLEEGAAFCPNCGSSVSVAPAPQLGLKWAHFLSYFALWLAQRAHRLRDVRIPCQSLHTR